MNEKIQIDLYSDWIDFLKNELSAAGYRLGCYGNPQEVAFRYFNVWIRQIDVIPREVRVAKSLKECLARIPPARQAGFHEIVRKAENGESLNPHLSEKLVKPGYNDELLNHWGLHHLHLGTGPHKKKKNGFLERTGPLLFAHVTAQVIYLVAILNHGRESWTNEDLVETILKEWPEILNPIELQGISGTSTTPEERARLRGNNMNEFMFLSNGKTYRPLGGGVVCAGLNIGAVPWHDRRRHLLRRVQNQICDELENLRRHIPPGRQFGSPPVFKLAMYTDGLVHQEIKVLETCSRVMFTFPLPDFAR